MHRKPRFAGRRGRLASRSAGARAGKAAGAAAAPARASPPEDDVYRAVVENARVVICVIDESGRCRFMNPFAARELGGRAEDFVGKTVWDLFPKEAADAYLGSVLQAIRTGSTVERETPTIVAGNYWGTLFFPRAIGFK